MLRTAIVTGANTGIGKAVAGQLAAAGFHVLLAARDEAKGRAAAQELNQAGSTGSVEFVQGDLGTVASTHAFADRLLERCPEIHALVNNAGVWMTAKQCNADGLELSFMVNHLAPFILSTRLWDRMAASAPARIVNVNAGLFLKGNADLDRLPRGGNFGRFKTYMDTKLLNVLFTVEMARRFPDGGVTINALHPGVIRTNLGAARGPLGMVLSLAKRFWGTPEDGARPVVRLVTDPELEKVSGAYFNEFEPFDLPPKAVDETKARELWDLSERLAARNPS